MCDRSGSPTDHSRVATFLDFCKATLCYRVEHIAQMTTVVTTNTLSILTGAYAEVRNLGLTKALEADLSTQAARSSMLDIMQHSLSREFYQQCKMLNTLYTVRGLLEKLEKHVKTETWKQYQEASTKLQEVTPTFLSAKAVS